MGLDDHLAPPVHRRVADRQHRRADQGRVIENSTRPSCMALISGP
jgi:hypothetical protein